MRHRRPHYIEPEDDGLVPIPFGHDPVTKRRRFKLVTPEEAHERAREIMAGFDQLSPAERYAWNYAKATPEFNPSRSPLLHNNTKAVKKAGAAAFLDEIGL